MRSGVEPLVVVIGILAAEARRLYVQPVVQSNIVFNSITKLGRQSIGNRVKRNDTLEIVPSLLIQRAPAQDDEGTCERPTSAIPRTIARVSVPLARP
jgi:hypothetical protein